MSDVQRPARTAIDALHAELLGTLVDIERSVQQLNDGLPAAKQGVESLASALTDAFDALHTKAVALVGYVKAKQLEAMGEIDAASRKLTAQSRKALDCVERLLWVCCALTGVNTLLLLGVVFLRH